MIISFSKDAKIDLERLNDFIANINPIAAKRIISTIINGIEQLTNFPDMGVEVKEFPKPELLRDIYILNYQIRYIKLKEIIIIVRIWHQKEI